MHARSAPLRGPDKTLTFDPGQSQLIPAWGTEGAFDFLLAGARVLVRGDDIPTGGLELEYSYELDEGAARPAVMFTAVIDMRGDWAGPGLFQPLDVVSYTYHRPVNAGADVVVPDSPSTGEQYVVLGMSAPTSPGSFVITPRAEDFTSVPARFPIR